MRKINESTLLIFTLTILAVSTVALAAGSQKKTSQHSTSRNESNWNWTHRDDDVKREVSIRGKVEFTDDYRDIKTISEGGLIRILDERGATSRRFEAVETSDGIKRSYWVNGQPQPINDEARAWLARMLEDAVVHGGYDARTRVKKILSERGPNGVLDEIAGIESDYVKKIYFDELAQSGSLDGASARRAIEMAGREMKSDYEKAGALMKLGENSLNDAATRNAFITAVGTMKSDYERGRVLSSLLKKNALDKDGLVLAVKTAAAFESDYEKAQVLIKIAAAAGGDQTVRDAVVETARTIKSDYERGRVLSTLFK
jgi:hypothetical protein